MALKWAQDRLPGPSPHWTDVSTGVASLRPQSPTKPENSANGMIQHDVAGAPLFLHANDPKFSPFDRANGLHNRAPRDWRHWNKAQVADLLRRGGAPNATVDLEKWTRDALYDLGCSAAFAGYAKRLLEKKRGERWTLDRRRTYASRLPCKLRIDATSEFGPMTFHHHRSDEAGAPRRPDHFAPTRDFAVPALRVDDAQLRECHAALRREASEEDSRRRRRRR